MKLFCTLALVATASALVETRLDSSMLDPLSGDAKFGAYKTMFGKSYGSAISASMQGQKSRFHERHRQLHCQR